jgi:hypothetical protein
MFLDAPIPGLYKCKSARHAPWQPVRISIDDCRDPLTSEPLDRPYRLVCTVAEHARPVEDVWPSCAGNPISPAEYRYLTELLSWTDQQGQARHEAVDLNTLPPLF